MKTQHVDKLTGREWVSLTVLLAAIGGAISFAAIYQAFKIGSFIPGSMASAVLAWPIIRYWLAKGDPSRAPHLTNYLQTGVSASGSAVGMGSMLLAFQWVTTSQLTGWQVAAMALPASLFGVAASNIFAESWINRQKLSFPTGTAVGAMLSGIHLGGKAFNMLALGALISVPLFVFKSPIEALVIGAGWIVGWEVMAWAVLTALVFQHFEPALLQAKLIESQYREFTVYLGACMIIAAGTVDMAFVFFSKNTDGDNPQFGEAKGFLPRGRNVMLLAGAALLMAVSMAVVFGLPFHVTLGIAALLVVLVYVGGTCLGKTDLGPVSALSGFVILLTGSFGKGGALLYGAMAGQGLANGMDQAQDYRTGERIGSSFPLQRKLQVMGACLGASLFLGLMYSLLTNAYSAKLTYEAVNTKNNLFDAGFAMKYYGFLSLRDKLGGMVGTACIWTLTITAIVQIFKNVLNKAGKKTLSRLIPSAYACSFATFVGFAVTWQQGIGAAIGAILFLIWLRLGKEATDPASEQKEPTLLGVNWSFMIGLPGGLIVGESLCAFVAAVATLLGNSGFYIGMTILLAVMVGIGLYAARLKIKYY